jgi:hypothetical protein
MVMRLALLAVLISFVSAQYKVGSWDSTISIVGGTSCLLNVQETIVLNFTGAPVVSNSYSRTLNNVDGYISPIQVTKISASGSSNIIISSQPTVASSQTGVTIGIGFTNTSAMDIVTLVLSYTLDGPLRGNIGAKTNSLSWIYQAAVPIAKITYNLKFPSSFNVDPNAINVDFPATTTSNSVSVVWTEGVAPSAPLSIHVSFPQQIFNCYAVDPSNTNTIVTVVVVVVVVGAVVIALIVLAILIVMKRRRDKMLFGAPTYVTSATTPQPASQPVQYPVQYPYANQNPIRHKENFDPYNSGNV